MKEYTILAVCSAVVVALLDVYVLKTKLVNKSTFWMFLLVMYACKMLVNGYLTWRPIVLYGEEFYLGYRIMTIPVEDFVYGFSLISLSIIVWEYLLKRSGSESPVSDN